MRNLIGLTAILLLMSVGLSAQHNVIDSLLESIARLPDDTTKVKELNQLGFSYASVDMELASLYADSALTLAKRLKWEAGQAYAIYTKGVISYYQGNIPQAISYTHKALHYRRKFNNPQDVISGLNFLCSIYQHDNQIDSAIHYANEALELAEKIDDRVNMGIANYNIGMLQKAINNKELAKTYMLKAIAYLQEEGETYFVAAAYQGMTTLTKGEEALSYAHQALDIFIQLGDIQGQGYCYSSIGTINQRLGNIEESYTALTQAHQIFEQLQYPLGIASTKSNLGLLMTEMGRFEASAPFLHESVAIAKSIGALDILNTSYRGLASYYAAQRQPDSVAATIDSLMALQDTLYTQEKADLIADANAKYQLKEQEAAMVASAEQQKRLRNRILLSALAAILALIILLQYLRNRQKIQRKEAELKLQIQQAEAQKLKELDRLKSSFFANISHEFRTPLTLIIGPIRQAIERLQKSPADEASLSQQDVKMIERNANRLQNLVGQLMDLSKLDSGKMKLLLTRGDLLGFLRAFVFSFESLAVRRKIAFRTSFPDALPIAYFDEDKLEKILGNLISNAFKYTPDGGQVAVDIKQADALLHIQVTDTGKGMPAEESAKIFDRFYQVEGTEAQGTGIGLALVKELIDLYKGKITVHSQPQQGTTFNLYLPFRQADFQPEELMGTAKPAKAASTFPLPQYLEDEPSESPTDKSDLPVVLVAEDNPDLRQYISKVLMPHYQVLTATDGKQGIAMAIAHTPDLIISDVLMPEKDGFQLCEAVKNDQRTSHIPVILLTAKAGQEHKIEGLTIGADDYLTKPFDHKELHIRTHNLIQQRHQLREKYSSGRTLKPKEIAVNSVDELFLEAVKQAIEENIDNESFSVEDLASAVAFSRSQLHRKLKALIGKSPNTLIRDFRLNRAKSLLEQGAGNVSQIATAVGYNSLSYFTQSFKQAFGVLPSEIGR